MSATIARTRTATRYSARACTVVHGRRWASS
jgi:hypothetical protein